MPSIHLIQIQKSHLNSKGGIPLDWGSPGTRSNYYGVVRAIRNAVIAPIDLALGKHVVKLQAPVLWTKICHAQTTEVDSSGKWRTLLDIKPPAQFWDPKEGFHKWLWCTALVHGTLLSHLTLSQHSHILSIERDWLGWIVQRNERILARMATSHEFNFYASVDWTHRYSHYWINQSIVTVQISYTLYWDKRPDSHQTLVFRMDFYWGSKS